MASEIIREYSNGNCLVTLHADGTKTRSWEGNPSPEFPESIDLKITDQCDAGCPFCHESSTRAGRHAAADDILGLISGLPAGPEIAIGGGDPLSHPKIDSMLQTMIARGLVPNLTVNGLHVGRYRSHIESMRKEGRIFGLGISYASARIDETLAVADENTVLHVIAGVAPTREMFHLPRDMKVLVLGYKSYGFGVRYRSEAVEQCLSAWRYWIGPLMRRFSSVSFDNLALEQLSIKKIVTEEVWNSHYMGDDGHFTMYIDAVERAFSKSSTSMRTPAGELTIRDMFSMVRQ